MKMKMKMKISVWNLADHIDFLGVGGLHLHSSGDVMFGLADHIDFLGVGGLHLHSSGDVMFGLAEQGDTRRGYKRRCSQWRYFDCNFGFDGGDYVVAEGAVVAVAVAVAVDRCDLGDREDFEGKVTGH
jgi:hypothetical protein